MSAGTTGGEVGAGGVVRRSAADGERIAVVHRKRHSDWVLPKGHPKEGESWEQAAVREVYEETGCIARVGHVAGAMTYEKDGRPKVVLVFDMVFEVDGERPKGDEVDEVAWLSPSAAEHRLTHRAERELIARHFRLDGGRLSARRRFESLNEERLRTALNVREPQLRAELRAAAVAHDGTSAAPGGEPWWVETAHELLDRSRQAHRARDVDEGWRDLHAVERLRFHGMDKPALQRARSRLLAEATEKLSGWRLEAVKDLAGTEDTVEATCLVQAQETLDEHFGNVYLRLQLYRDRLRWPLGLAAAAVLLFLFASWRRWLPDEWSLLDSWQQVVVVVLLGTLGAMLSTSVSVFRQSRHQRIPDVIGKNLDPLVRLVVGAASAVVVVLVLETDIQSAVEVSEEGLYPFAVAAGFTERLVTRMMTSLEAAAGKDATDHSHEG